MSDRIGTDASLQELEARIEDNLVEVGLALAAIKTRRLYKEEYGTWERYCDERWSWTPQWANRRIKAAKVLEQSTTESGLSVDRSAKRPSIDNLARVASRKLPETFARPSAKETHEPRLLLGNAFELIDHLDDQSIQLTLTSPPYNIGKEYEVRQPLEDYLAPYRQFARNLFAKTAQRGSVCWQVGNYFHERQVLPLDYAFYPIFQEAGFRLRNRIVWFFRHGLPNWTRFPVRYEVILWFTKSDQYTFNLDSVRVPHQNPAKKAYTGPRRGELSCHHRGKNPGDCWDFDYPWDIPNVKGNHPEKTKHPCQFPLQLVERCVNAFTNPGDTVLDPFMGSGTTGLGAITLGCEFIGIEKEPAYLEIAERRLLDARMDDDSNGHLDTIALAS